MLDDKKFGAFNTNADHPPVAGSAAAWDGLSLKALFGKTVEDYFRYNGPLARLLFTGPAEQLRARFRGGEAQVVSSYRTTQVQAAMSLSDELFYQSYVDKGRITEMAVGAIVRNVVQEVAYAMVADHAELLLPKPLPELGYRFSQGLPVCGIEAYHHLREAYFKERARYGDPSSKDDQAIVLLERLPEDQVVWLPEVRANAAKAFEQAEVYMSPPSPNTRVQQVQILLRDVPVLTYVERAELYQL
jgi:hypothetical protein